MNVMWFCNRWTNIRINWNHSFIRTTIDLTIFFFVLFQIDTQNIWNGENKGTHFKCQKETISALWKTERKRKCEIEKKNNKHISLWLPKKKKNITSLEWVLMTIRRQTDWKLTHKKTFAKCRKTAKKNNNNKKKRKHCLEVFLCNARKKWSECWADFRRLDSMRVRCFTTHSRPTFPVHKLNKMISCVTICVCG